MPMPDINQYLKHYSGNVSDQIAAARPYGQACWDERGKEEAAKNCTNCKNLSLEGGLDGDFYLCTPTGLCFYENMDLKEQFEYFAKFKCNNWEGIKNGN